MGSLELKVPPVLLVLICMLVIWLVAKALPVIHLSEVARYSLFSMFALTGMFVAIAGVFSFKQGNTTVNPTRPDTSSSLVTSGIYKFTRNPMYVGFALLLIAWTAFLSSLYSLPVIIGFVFYMTSYQIKPEELALEKVFGNEFLTYKNRVRRWF